MNPADFTITAPDLAITAHGATKNFGRFTLGPLTFGLHSGEVTALVGPNGAGKTTLIKALLGQIALTSGSLVVDGVAPGKPARVAAVVDSPYLIPEWSIREAMSAIRSFYATWDDNLAQSLLLRFHLGPASKVKQLSRGEGNKFKLLLALAAQPHLLVLDEPTSGLDPLAREEILDVLREYMVEATHAILFSTHIPADLGTIADRILVIREGQFVFDGSMDSLTESYFSVKGSITDLPPIRGQLIGVRATATTFSAVVEARNTAGIPPTVVIEEASIDDVVKALAVTPAETSQSLPRKNVQDTPAAGSPVAGSPASGGPATHSPRAMTPDTRHAR